MKKFTILPVIAAFIAIMAFAPQDAHAASWSPSGSGDWSAVGLPNPVIAGDTVTIPASDTITISTPVKSSGHVILGGTLQINDPNGAFTTTLGGLLDILGTGHINNLNTHIPISPGPAQGLLSSGTTHNAGVIDNHGFFGTRGTAINTGTVNNFLFAIISATFTNNGVWNNMACGNPTVTDRTGLLINDFLGNPMNINVQCPNPSIPEFPIPFSMIIIFAAVAAVYMGIRQKMIPGFKI